MHRDQGRAEKGSLPISFLLRLHPSSPTLSREWPCACLVERSCAVAPPIGVVAIPPDQVFAQPRSSGGAAHEVGY